VFNLSFDRDEAADRRAAEACYAEAVQRLSEKGYYPYRVAHGHILPFASPTDTYYACLKKIKDALDPQGILFPGRYDVPAKIE
jgi:4-cresol dehydrogenase (hydroxylating)